MKIKIEGIKETQDFLEQKKESIEEGREKGMGKVALYMEAQVKSSIAGHEAETTSVDTGRFLNSVKGENDETTAVISTNLDYPEYLEYGTSTIKPRRHFNNSLDRNKEKIKYFLQSEVSMAVKK